MNPNKLRISPVSAPTNCPCWRPACLICCWVVRELSVELKPSPVLVPVRADIPCPKVRVPKGPWLAALRIAEAPKVEPVVPPVRAVRLNWASAICGESPNAKTANKQVNHQNEVESRLTDDCVLTITPPPTTPIDYVTYRQMTGAPSPRKLPAETTQKSHNSATWNYVRRTGGSPRKPRLNSFELKTCEGSRSLPLFGLPRSCLARIWLVDNPAWRCVGVCQLSPTNNKVCPLPFYSGETCHH